MAFKRYVRELYSYSRSGPAPNKSKIQKIIEMYRSKKIPNFKTALNAVLLVASNHKLTISSNQAIKKHDQMMAKYSEAIRIPGIPSRRTAKRKRPLLTMRVVFYGSIDEEIEAPARTKNKTFQRS